MIRNVTSNQYYYDLLNKIYKTQTKNKKIKK